MSLLNCWEYKKCGRQPGGNKVAELGECVAVSCFKAHGLNHGINGGRACWAITGTFCGGIIQGSFVDKHRNCASCDFFHTVIKEEGENLTPVQEILTLLTTGRKSSP
ncbi:MAG: hypothetical protein KKD63_02785 [Proteobacteria bacterium]|nr:hypothetical protein [Pseudomonadota bacterium]MDP2105276.1 hypothetical protein [Desulfobulbaceae bacterium]